MPLFLRMEPSDILDREGYNKDDYTQEWARFHTYKYHQEWFDRHTNKWIKYQEELERIAENEWDFTRTDTPKWDWIYHRIREYIRKYIYKANQIAVLKGLCLTSCTFEEHRKYSLTMFDLDDMKTDYKGYGPETLQFILYEDWLDEYYGDIE